MELKTLETKCPVCGHKNTPDEFSAEISTGTTVKAEYHCTGKIRRIFRKAKPCQTQYRIVLRNDAAERVISEMSLAAEMNYGTGKGREG